ncbi:MAG: hypothetical protein IJU91_03335 [Selenomonadaceae bacterium]|nr:hypothetical protein [Selenomonadaceae bacterium]
MRQVIVTFRRSYKIFLAVAAILAIQLISAGQTSLCGSILIGALLSFFYFLSTAARLETAAKMNQTQAKKIMLVGMILRLLMVFVVLAVAAHISTQLFVASSVCFVVFYITALGVLVYDERR